MVCKVKLMALFCEQIFSSTNRAQKELILMVYLLKAGEVFKAMYSSPQEALVKKMMSAAILEMCASAVGED